jgi:quercetin dioxygenase-like cupin family protein
MDDQGQKSGEQGRAVYTPKKLLSQDFEWEGVPVLHYKEGPETHFRDITKRVLFSGHPDLPTELRYFEIGPRGHSTLERHEHLHVVMVLRGRGRCLVGMRVYEIHFGDVVQVPAMTWHQFYACYDEPFGFLCLVNIERDRPQLPTADDINELGKHREVGLLLAEIAK